MFNVGDLVWSEYYNRLGRISRVITDLPGYTKENPGYDVANPMISPTKAEKLIGGVREITQSHVGSNLVTSKLVLIAKGFQTVCNEELEKTEEK